MTELVGQVLGLALLLQCKHVIADFVLQTRYILDNRYRYGHPGGILHVGFHLFGSAAALMMIGTSTNTLIIILFIEGVFHYHLDWAKDNYVRRSGLKTTDYMYWFAMGIDQLLHQISYIGMIWLWLFWQIG